MKRPCVDWSVVEGWKLKPWTGMLEGKPSDVAARVSADGYSRGVEEGWRRGWDSCGAHCKREMARILRARMKEMK